MFQSVRQKDKKIKIKNKNLSHSKNYNGKIEKNFVYRSAVVVVEVVVVDITPVPHRNDPRFTLIYHQQNFLTYLHNKNFRYLFTLYISLVFLLLTRSFYPTFLV